MGKIQLDFSELPEREPLPNGKFRIEVDKVEVRDSKSSDHPYLNWELNVLDEEYQGRKLWYMTSLHPNALPRLEDQLLQLDVVGDRGEKIEFEFDTSSRILTSPDLTGLVAMAQVRVDVYQGEKRNYVDVLTPAEATTVIIRGDGAARDLK